MKADYLARASSETLLDPEAQLWQAAESESFELMGTPASMQPTPLIRAAWTNRATGIVESVKVAALHNGSALAIRLEWEDASENRGHGDNTSFPDGAAIAFPVNGDAPLLNMGAEQAPINVWHWRADADGAGRQLNAVGIGTSETVDTVQVRGKGVWRDGRWRVCISRDLVVEGTPPGVRLEAGGVAKFGVAIWEGSRGERGGIKAFSGPIWIDLELAAG